MKWRYFVLLGLCAFACHRVRDPLSVHSEALTHKSLASYHIRTPDPKLKQPYKGQRLYVRWNLPESVFRTKDPVVELRVRYGNQEEEVFHHAIESRHGKVHYDWVNEDYVSRRGIVTFKATIKSNDEELYLWEHQIWADRMDLSQE